MPNRIGIRALIAASLFAALIAALPVFWFMLAPSLSHALAARHADAAVLTARLLAATVTRDGAVGAGRVELERATRAELDRVTRKAGVTRWWFSGAGGLPLTSPLAWDPREEERAFAASALERGDAVVGHAGGGQAGVGGGGRRALHVALPVRLIGGETGTLLVEFDLAGLDAEMSRLTRNAALASLAALMLAGVLAAIFLARFVALPISRIRAAMAAVERGEVARASTVGPREIAELARDLNAMVETLATRQKRIETKIAEQIRINRELREAQEAMLRAETLASVGRLAGGVAHEIGNPIGAIIGYTEMLRDPTLPREVADDFLRRMESELERIRVTLRQLTDFSRPKAAEVAPTDVNGSVRATVELARVEKRMRNMRVVLTLDEGLMAVVADESELRQVVLNLVLNAADACGGEGEIAITTGVVEGVPTLTVADDGPGISAENIVRIFEPFFTTKGSGKGSGVGLAICRRLVESWGGRIDVASQVGGGARFVIRFVGAKVAENAA